MSERSAPGWYHGSGDPPNTVRYWDGAAWTTEAVPPPPGWRDRSEFKVELGSPGRRIAAAVIDGFIALGAAMPFYVGYIRDVFDDIDAGGDGTAVAIPPSLYLAIGTIMIGFLVMVAYRGGTPGKLLLGLRITTSDGITSPPGFVRAFRRSLPAVLGWLPTIGPVINIVLPVIALVMVVSDDENRSLYDRIADTRVVRVQR